MKTKTFNVPVIVTATKEQLIRVFNDWYNEYLQNPNEFSWPENASDYGEGATTKLIELLNKIQDDKQDT